MNFILAMIQCNPHVGALDKNLAMMIAKCRQAKEQGADLAVFPELALCGYPPEDLLLKPAFLERLQESERRFNQALAAMGMDALYGTVHQEGKRLLNVGALSRRGEVIGRAVKRHLPNYSVFDEHRYFSAGHEHHPLVYREVPLAVTICEDIWQPGEPLASLARAGARMIINLNASPYHVGKQREREAIVAQRAGELSLPVVYVNLVGGQDELVFDGLSFALEPGTAGSGEAAAGRLVTRAGFCQEEIRLVRVEDRGPGQPLGLAGEAPAPLPSEEGEIYQVIRLGIHDYVEKNGFQGVVLGLSGGIDSALTAVICADALGPERVEALMMPSPFTSRESLDDAAELANRLGIRLVELSIDPMFRAFREQLRGEFAGLAEDVTEENLQPRIRATLLMAVSNKKGYMLVTTGNKSEMSVGYATLYGDMAGGYSAIKDLLKEDVYRLSVARNRWAAEAGAIPPIPERVIDKPPSAELKPHQQDTDSLPPYPVLDRILKLYVEEEWSLERIVAQGLEREVVSRVIGLVDRSEFKRRQAPPGVRVTRRAFGKDWRYPITNGFKAT